MNRTLIKLCKFNSNFNLTRQSALFVNGAKATEQFVYVSPHVDISEHLKNKDSTQAQLNKRKVNISLENVENLWSLYEELKSRKLEYEKKKADISRELGKLIKSEPDSDTTKQMKIQVDLIKDNIKKLKVPLWSAEEAAILEALKLPNNLHTKTPDTEYKILYTHLPTPKNSKNHLAIGEQLNLIKFNNNENYYLTGDAAIFELGSKFHFSSILKRNNFVQLSNPDFVKSVIIEGCGENHTNPDSTYILHHNEESKVNKDSRLHLTGGASLYSFWAYHTKNVIYSKVMPIKYFTIGRRYVPSSKQNGLFNVSQSTVIEVFGVTKTASDLDNLLNELTDILKSTFAEFNYHFRLVIVPANKLKMYESLRIELQMFSTSLQQYVDVANISLVGDFIPKRLMFTYIENKENKFPNVLSGTVLNVPKFLACVLEQDHDFVLPDCFSVNKWM